MVLRLPFRRPHSCARRSLFLGGELERARGGLDPPDAAPHRWSLEHLEQELEQTLLPLSCQGGRGCKYKYEVKMTHTWCVWISNPTEGFTLNVWLLRFWEFLVLMWECVCCVYLKAGQEAASLCPSCLPCQTMVTGSLGIPGTGSYWTASLSQCMPVSRRNMHCGPENILIIHKCNNSHKSWIESIKKSHVSHLATKTL